ncbi:adenylyl-sulfate kinase [Cytophaga hutchinsonii]|uniref:Adenylyl-sulfate kinase n=1 Tax=Cytophaga hutchinsonii (strain ATCC 33406 / DSM 1761 / CIP 103989 / NBRC 15051 / NCIMB 9469 / D465) TaxID=269798 RepID=A0A6N4SNR3_CYTH3|nr:adenylyl-sulfate kinase [Cytophaga hutchinsonii]ABG57924.1 adenylylsulfate kinase [Cytophaga hutchinsonii ATCC 33406]SFX09144.1 adenylylsulfate kinase [Cytophaga hutchinsonii ATCC 33406]
MNHIHPIFDKILQREDKEAQLKQHSIVIWMVGLSGSGKSTLAKALERDLHDRGFLTTLLDGDNLRTGINNNLGFTEADRTENIRRAAETSKLFAACGIITICSLISPTEEIRSMSKNIIGANDYFELFVNTPIEVCEQRDVKGLYKKARAGEIKNFTGIDSPFEHPKAPSLEVRTDLHSLEDCLQQILTAILPKITY